MAKNCDLSQRYTPLGFDANGLEKAVGVDAQAYQSEMDAVVDAILHKFRRRLSENIQKNPHRSLKIETFDSAMAECFANTDWGMREWLINHSILTETVKRKAIQDNEPGIETLSIGYTGKDRLFVIFRLFEIEKSNYSMGCWSLSDEFWVEKSNGLIVHPRYLRFRHY
jgi:hypothetical protein